MIQTNHSERELYSSTYAAIHAACSIPALEAALNPILDHFEISHCFGAHVRGIEFIPEYKPMFGRWHTRWAQHYISMGHYTIDPVPAYASGLKNDLMPFYWSELISEKQLTRSQLQLFAEAWDAELQEGLVFPMPIGDASGIVSMAWRHPRKMDPVTTGILHLIARDSFWQAYHILEKQYNRLQLMPNVLDIASTPDIASLTPRELDILSKLAQDKKPQDIALILGMNPQTVANYLVSIRQKLNVQTNHGAVYVALQYKLCR